MGSRWFPQKLSKFCGAKCAIDIFKQAIETEEMNEQLDISSETMDQLSTLIEREEKNKKVYHTECGDGESCYFFKLRFEDFYAVSPKIPRYTEYFIWWIGILFYLSKMGTRV